jgi:hypothetical protein
MSLFALAIALSVAATPVMAAADLSALQWQNRVIVVFGAANDPAAREQLDRFRSHADALAERDMLVLSVDDTGVTSLFGTAPDFDPDTIRQRLDHTGDRFAVLLIGKDGGVKLRQETPVDPAEIFGLVDSMPMRRNEVSQR